MNASGSLVTFLIRPFFYSSLLVVYFTSSVVAQSWQQIDRLTAGDAETGDQLGSAVALQGGIALVGADRDGDENDGGDSSGSAYLFEEDGIGNWLQPSKLTASDADMGDRFGASVAISGNTALVGAPFGDKASLANVGAAYLFQDDGMGNWLETKLTAGDAVFMEEDQFGASVALAGNLALVGAWLDDDKDSNAGAAYLFENDGLGNWSQIAKLTADDAMSSDNFGFSVAISGNTAIIGATFGDSTTSNVGAAYLFQDDGGGNWNQIAKLTADDAMSNDNFGFSVAISGNTALIGAPFGDSTTFSNVGAAYLFQDDGSGDWNEIAKLTAADAAFLELDQFGASVALENGTALVGAFLDSDAGFFSGSAYLFEDDGSGSWNQIEKLTADDAAANDLFGESVALDGNTALIGATGSSGTGGAYVFAPFSAADFNEDGNVDDTDLAFWQAGYGTSIGAGLLDGDADEDGDVDGADFLIWQREFTGPSVLSSLSQVPEPSSLLLATTLFFVITRREYRNFFGCSAATKRGHLIFR